MFGASQNNQSSQPGMQTSANAFTFSAGQPDSNPFNSVPPTNPFASVNGNGSNPFGSTNGSFGATGMNTGKRSSDDMMMESPEKKQAGGHPFGRHQGFNWANPSQSQPQQPTPAPTFSFGTSQNNTSNQSNGGLFGSVSKADQPSSNLFGQTQSTQPTFGGFGQSSQTTSAPSSSYGQKDQTPTPPPSFSTSFGQTTSEPPKFQFGQPATTQTSQAANSPFMFGQGSTTQKPDAPSFGSNESSRATSPFKFGTDSSSTSTAGNLFAGIQAPSPVRQYTFGQKPDDSTSEKPEEPEPKPSLFGQSTTSQPSTALFAPSASSQTAPNLSGFSSSSAQTTSGFSFGQPAKSQSSAAQEKPAEAPKSVFANVPSLSAASQTSTQPASAVTDIAKPAGFSFAAAPTPSVGSLGASTIAPPASSNLFGLPKPSQTPATGLFGSPSKAPEAPKEPDTAGAPKSPEKPQQSKPSFSFGNAQPPSSGGLFTPVKATSSDKAAATEPAKPPAFGGGSPLFQRAPPVAAEPGTEKAKKPLFGRTLDSSSTSSQPAAPEPALKAPLFGAPQAAKPPASETSDRSAPSSFTTAPPAPKPTSRPQPSAANQAVSREPPPQRPAYTKSPARVPTFLNGEGYKEFDNNFRLRALNREFQRRIAALDPSRHDFENIIRHYVAARASIGADIGLYQRTMAGTKRKNDTIDEEELEVPQQYKKAKASDGQSSAPAPSQPVPKNNTFGNATAAPQPQTSRTATPSKATSMFNEMIPRSPGKTSEPPKPAASEKPVSVFASVPQQPPAGESFLRKLVNEIENDSAPKAPGAPTFSKQAPSTTPAKPPQGFVPGVPTVAAGNAFAAFASAAANNDKKRKIERLEDEYSSDEDSQAEGRKKLEEEERVKRAKYDSIPKTGFTPTFQQKSTSPSKSPSKTGFTPGFGKSTSPSKSPPKSGFTPLGGSAGKDFSPPKPSSSKAKRNSPFEEDSDEDEDDVEGEADDEETTEEKDGEFAPEDEESTEESQDDEDEEDDLPEDEVQEDTEDDNVDHQAEIEANPNKGKSLFDRIEPNPVNPSDTPVNGDNDYRVYKSIESGFKFPKSDDPIMGSAKNSSFKPSIFGAHIGKSTPEAPAFSPITPATTSSYKPATTFNFTATPPTTTPTPVPGASVLSGGLTSVAYAKFDGMFGSRPTTPNPVDKDSPAPAPAFGPVNHTWSAGSPIKFGETPEKATAPKINLTEASPEKDGDQTPKASTAAPFGSLFGTTPASTFKSGETNSGFSFGTGLPDFLTARKPFETASGLTSGISSRGTSPGLTDAESVQTDTSDNMPAEPQANLSESRVGEEDEDCLFEAKSKALKFISAEAAKGTKFEPNTWATQGVGMIRLLKHKDTGKCRVLFRAEPGGNIVVNANLLPKMEYVSIDQAKSGAVKGPFYNDKKKTLERWVFKLKTKDMADELEELIKGNQVE